jgi:glycine cleavage system H protein
MAQETYPADLLYHAEHDWARLDGDIATLGITWHAQDAMGEIVFCEPPEPGSQITQGDAYAEVESVKAVSDVIAPLSGEVVEANRDLDSSPEALNEDPYGAGWIVKIRISDPSERDSLMDQETYVASLTA